MKRNGFTPLEKTFLTGFTLIELIVVVVLIGIIAGFAIPNYDKAIRKAHERDMSTQMMALHAANMIYRANAGKYWDTATVPETALSVINSTLGINIISNDGTTYSYTSNVGGTTFTATARWGAYTIQIDQNPISGTNPSCATGNCLTL